MTRRVSIEEIRKLSQRSRQELYGDGSDLPVSSDGAQDNTPSTSVLQPEYQTNSVKSTRFESRSEFSRHNKATKPLENALRIIRAQSQHVLPFLFRHEAALLGHVHGGASVMEAEKEAIRHNLIVKHILARAKTNVCFWEIADQGYEQLKRTRPEWGSKGRYKHKFCVHRIENTYRHYGYQTGIEYRRPNGKLVDLHLSNENLVLYVEVCASWPIEKELTNIQKDLEGDSLPSEIILAVTERKMRKPLEQAVCEMNADMELLRPVRVVLAGNLIDFLELTK